MQCGKFPTCFVVMDKYFDILIKRYVIFVLLSWVVITVSMVADFSQICNITLPGSDVHQPSKCATDKF